MTTRALVFRFGMVHGITGRLPVGYDTVATHGQPQSHEVSRPGDYITEVHRMWDEQQVTASHGAGGQGAPAKRRARFATPRWRPCSATRSARPPTLRRALLPSLLRRQ